MGLHMHVAIVTTDLIILIAIAGYYGCNFIIHTLLQQCMLNCCYALIATLTYLLQV